jgi:cytochrome P450
VDTTWLTLGSLMYAVLEHPEVHGRLLEDETERAWAVEETLRWESAVGTEPRVTIQDVVVSGVEIPAGELVRLCIPVANRDPAVFSDPDRWDLDRRPSNHIAFGLGRHFCLGAFLARGELQVALEVLLRLMRTCNPHLRHGGSIINVSSGSAYIAGPPGLDAVEVSCLQVGLSGIGG